MPSQQADRAATLKKVPLFANLSEKELYFLAERAVRCSYDAGERVFSEGEPCEGLYVIESGAIKIFKMSPGGREQVLTVGRAGHSVAELPVFDGGNYPASALAAEGSVLLFIDKRDFQTLCLQHPEVALKVLRVVGSRLRQLVGIIEELSFTTVRQRLAALLLRMAQNGNRTSRGIEFCLAANRQELAAQIGTVRELVSRNLGRLQAEGILKIDGRTVLIENLEALRAEVEGGE